MSAANQPYPEGSVTEITPGTAFAQTGLPDVVVIAGPTSRGPFTPTLLAPGDIATLTATYGTGDAVKKAAYAMARVASQVCFLRMLTAAVTGTLGAVTAVLNGSSTITSHVLSGTPTAGADVVVLFGTVGGNTGTGPIAYTVSTNGGVDFGTTQALGTGLTITVLGVTVTLLTAKVVTAGDTLAWLQTVASSAMLPTTFTGTGTSVITTTGNTPFDAYEFAFECMVGGTIGSATNPPSYRYTLDYGAPEPTWFPVASLATANTLAIIDGPNSGNTTNPNGEPAGFGLAFAAGTLVAGDLFTFGTSAPAYDSNGLTSATNALVNGNVSWTWPYFCGAVAEPLAAAADTIVTNWDQGAKPSWGVVDSRDRAGTETLVAWSARIDTEFTPYTSTHVGVGKGKARGVCPITGRNNRRDAFMFCLARAMGANGATIATDWAQKDLGPLSTDVSLVDINNKQVEYDSFHDQNGVQMGFIALRTWLGEIGVFPAAASLLGPDGNIKIIPIRRVFNVFKILEKQIVLLPVCKAFRQWKEGATPSTYKVGDVFEPDARNIEQIGTDILTAGVFNRGWCSGVSFKINRTPIALGGGNWKLVSAGQMTPLIYIKQSDATAQLVSADTPTA